jgi:hypothetical protein
MCGLMPLVVDELCKIFIAARFTRADVELDISRVGLEVSA